MQHNTNSLDGQTVLITGAAHRVGAVIARYLHRCGANIVLHYRNSRVPAEQLQQQLNRDRADSVVLLQADLLAVGQLPQMVQQAADVWGRLDVLVNNASTFYATPVGEIGLDHWQDLVGSNLQAPLFLSQAAAPFLKQQQGCIVNITDIHGERPLKGYPVYSIAKAGLIMLTRALACELGPDVRVNGVSPGAILWPQGELDDEDKERITGRTFLKRKGDPQDIAKAVRYLIADAPYVTGQVLAVDGGRSQNS